MKRLLPLILVLAFAATQLASATSPWPSNEFTWTEQFFPSKDGTMLRADVMLPKHHDKGDERPVILSIGPYFGRNMLNGGSTGPVMRFKDLIDEGLIFSRGYAYVQVDSRGYGGSGGCNDFGGPGEQADVEAAVNWAGSQPWSNGNVGMWGKSYDAWTEVMALAENPVHLKAVVIQSPLINAYRALFMNGVHFDAGWYTTPMLYAGWDLAPTTASDAPPEEHLYPALGTATNPHCYAQNLAFTTQPEESLAYWKQRDIIKSASASRIPVLWSHGFNDINTKPTNIFPVYAKLKGPKRAWFGQWDHVRGNQAGLVGRDGFMDEAMDWFDRYLKERVVMPSGYPGSTTTIQRGDGTWRSEYGWPPEDAKRKTLTLKGGQYLDTLVRPAATPVPSSFWSGTSKAPHALHIAGEIRVDATVASTEPNANVIVRVFDVNNKGEGRLITKGAQLVRSDGKVSFSLWPQDWLIAKGHRIAVEVSRKDPAFAPTSTGALVTISKLNLSVPFLQFERVEFLRGKPAKAMDAVEELDLSSALSGRTSSTSFPPKMQKPR